MGGDRSPATLSPSTMKVMLFNFTTVFFMAQNYLMIGIQTKAIVVTGLVKHLLIALQITC